MSDRGLMERAVRRGVLKPLGSEGSLDVQGLWEQRRTAFTTLEVIWDPGSQRVLGGVRSVDGVELSAEEVRAELGLAL